MLPAPRSLSNRRGPAPARRLVDRAGAQPVTAKTRPILAVDWEDSCDRNAWQDVADAPKAKLIAVTTIGAVVYENSKVLVLARSFDDADLIEGRFTIAKSLIRRRTRLGRIGKAHEVKR